MASSTKKIDVFEQLDTKFCTSTVYSPAAASVNVLALPIGVPVAVGPEYHVKV